jgi:hypothetical protein
LYREGGDPVAEFDVLAVLNVLGVDFVEQAQVSAVGPVGRAAWSVLAGRRRRGRATASSGLGSPAAASRNQISHVLGLLDSAEHKIIRSRHSDLIGPDEPFGETR